MRKFVLSVLLLGLCSPAFATDWKTWVPGLATATAPGASDYYALVQGGATKKVAGSSLLYGTNNLSDLTNIVTARNNLGLGPLATSASISAALDSIGSTQGGILFRGASVWSYLPPGGSGQFLQTLGAAANPQWVSLTGGAAAGSNSQAQYNNAGSLGGTSGLTLSATKVTSMSVGIGSDATGDIYYNSGGGAFARLPIGGSNTVLHGGAVPSYGAVALANMATQAANTVLANTTGGTTTPSAVSMPACPDTAGQHLNYTSGSGFACGTSGGGGGGTTPVLFVGQTSGTNTYAATPTPTYTSNVAENRFCGIFTSTNTGASTLNLATTGAVAITVQNSGGTAALVGGEIIANNLYCMSLNASATAWIMDTQNRSLTRYAATTQTAGAADFANGTTYVFTTAGQTLNLASAATLSPNGQILVITRGTFVTLTPGGADGINGGSVGVSISIPSGSVMPVSTSGSGGTTAFTVPLLQRKDNWTWTPGLNLAASTNGIPFDRFGGNTHRVVSITCIPLTLAGGAVTFDVYKAPAGTASLSTGTKLNTNACNANTNAGTLQDMLVANSALAAGDVVGIVATGTSTSGAGILQFTYE